MHTKSSINVKPVKDNSEAHNLRTGKPLSYVRQDLTEKNTSVVLEDVRIARTRLEQLAKAKTGRAMQKKATPIREGVVNLGKKQNLKDLMRMSQKLEEKLGMKAIQVHIHEDEGHYEKKTGDWKPNRHAHIVFTWMDENTGKSLRLKKFQMVEMQNIVAEELGMERGQSSDKKHLNAMEFKRRKAEEDAIKLEKEAKEAEKELKQLKLKHATEKTSEGIKKGFKQAFDRIGGVSEAQQYKKELEEKNEEYNKLYEIAQALQNDRDRYKTVAKSEQEQKEELKQENNKKDRWLRELSEENKKLARRNEELKENMEYNRKMIRRVASGEANEENARRYLQETKFQEKLINPGKNQGPKVG